MPILKEKIEKQEKPGEKEVGSTEPALKVAELKEKNASVSLGAMEIEGSPEEEPAIRAQVEFINPGESLFVNRDYFKTTRVNIRDIRHISVGDQP